MMLFSEFVSLRSFERLRSGRIRTSRAYRSTLNSVLSYACRDVYLKDVYRKDFLLGYQFFLEKKGLSLSTVSFYMRMLRSLYHSSVDLGYVSYIPKLFKHVYTGVVVTAKRAVSVNSIRCIKELSLSGSSSLDLSRDLFMFSLYAQGISFVDMAYLTKSSLVGSTLSYHRRKTGSKVTVALIPEAFSILDKYASSLEGSPYLLPVLNNCSSRSLYLQYESSLRKFNKDLKRIASLAGIPDKLTSYTARHSWATFAYHGGVDVSVISQGMGHRTEEITRIYLSSFSIDALAKANDLIYNLLMGTCGNGKFRHLVSDRRNLLQT